MKYAIKRPTRFFLVLWLIKFALFFAVFVLDFQLAKGTIAVYGGITASISMGLGLYFLRGKHPLARSVAWVLLAESAGLWTTTAFALVAGVWDWSNEHSHYWMRFFMFSSANLSSIHFTLTLEMYLRKI